MQEHWPVKNRKSTHQPLPRRHLKTVVAGVGIVSIVAITAIIYIAAAPKIIHQDSTIKPTAKVQAKATVSETDISNKKESPVSNQNSKDQPVTQSPGVISKPPMSTQSPPPTTQQAPSQRPFAVTSGSLDQAQVYCSGGNYMVSINDFRISLANSEGGSLSYGFEVTGGIADSWNGYRQQVTVPMGTTYTSLSKLYWGGSSDPHPLYTQNISSGHGPAAVRVAIYSPNLIYSPWINIPAQMSGEACA